MQFFGFRLATEPATLRINQVVEYLLLDLHTRY